MKNKILIMILTVVLMFPSMGNVFAEEVENTELESITTENTQVEEMQEELKEEEIVKEPEENNKKEIEIPKATSKKANIKKESSEQEEIKRERKTIKITLNFIDIRKPNGSVKQTSTSNNISVNGSWGFTKKKFENTTGLRVGDVAIYNGREYTYNGKWICDFAPSTEIDATATFYLWNKEGENSNNSYYLDENTTLTFSPIWTPVQMYTLTANYIDNIGNGGGGESHIDNGRTGYIHTFKTPADIPENYEFVYWKDFDNNSLIYWVDSDEYKNNKGTYIAEEKIGIKADSLEKDDAIALTAVYQPIITVNYYDEDGTYLESITGKEIDIYNSKKAPEKDTAFLGWYEDEILIEEGAIKTLDLTTEEVPTEFNVYAKYEEKVAPDPFTPDPINPDPITPTIEPEIVTPKTVFTPKKETKTLQPIFNTNNTNPFEPVTYNTTEEIEESIPILDEKPPLTTITKGKEKKVGSWALINLLTVILNFIIGIFLLVMAIINKMKKDKDIKINNKIILRIATIIIAIISAIVFILTENIHLPMILIDRWTILMVIILIINLLIAVFAWHKEKDKEK